jgi:hypothetical protein
MPDLALYDAAPEKWVGNGEALRVAVLRGHNRPCAQRVHQVRADLGRLAARAEILQVGPRLNGSVGSR